MSPKGIEQVKAILVEAIETIGPKRQAFLDSACGNDAMLRAEVESLLAAVEEAGEFLKCSNPDGLTSREDRSHERPGATIGPYKLLQLIGEGGFGSVFMADQEFPVRRGVALKVIKLGMDTKQVIARFEAERQALAMMEHPHIAKVLDAGVTDSGRPYFVMELVKGEPITEFADHHQLTIPQRLELFSQVCHAVQHAHQKGIIHRDIKPRNVLVSMQDGRPLAKVIDFGIAKAISTQLTDKTLFTEFKQLVGTPQYMSPEQAAGSLDLDTRTDIYSLGVLLYELLTGTTPFSAEELRSAAYDEMRRIIREEEPPKPSTRLGDSTATLTAVAALRRSEPRKLGSIVRGDLDWIVMKSLEKDRGRRYGTPGEIAADLRRYLDHEVVLATPPSAVYQLTKFYHRHRGAVITGSTVVVALVLGVIGTSIGFVRSRAAEREARENFNTARTALDDLLVVADQDLHDAPGMEPLRVKLWREAIDHYKPFLERPSADPGARAALAQLYVKSAFAAEYIGADHEKVAVPAYQSALAIQEQLVREHPRDRELRSNLGWTHLLSVWYGPDGPVRSNSLAKAVAIFEALAGETPGDPLARADLAWALYNSSWSAGAQRRALSDRVLAIRERLVREFPQSAEFRRDLADSLRQQGTLIQNDLPAALAQLSRSINLDAALEEDFKQQVAAIWLPARPSVTEMIRPSLRSARCDEAAGCLAAARVEGRLGKWTEALILADRAVGIYRRLVEQNLTVTEFTTGLWRADEFCASAADQSEGAAGGQIRRVAATNFWVDLARESGQEPLHGSGYSITVGRGQREIADLLRQKGQLQQAEQILRGTVEFFVKATQEYPAEPMMRREQAFTRHKHADVLEELGRSDDAVSEYKASIVLSAGVKAALPADSFNYQQEAYTTWMLAETLEKAGRLDAAEAEYRQAIALHEKAIAVFPSEALFTEQLGTVKEHLAELLDQRGNMLELKSQQEQAEQMLRDTIELFEKAIQEYPNDPYMRQEQALSRRVLGDVLEQLGRVAESESEYRAAIAMYAGLEASIPTNAFYRQEECYTTWMLAEMLHRANLLDKAEVEYRRGIALHEEANDDFPNEAVFIERLGAIQAHLAELLSQLGRLPEAGAMYQEAAERGSASERNELAWFFATSADPSLRDGTNAVAFGEKAVAATRRKNVSYLDTLAAAYAETGQFAKAINIQKEAIALSQSEDEKKGLASRLKLYENNSPYRDDGELAVLANARLSEGKFVEAEGLARECLTLREIQMPDDWHTFNARSMLGGSLLGQKKYVDAEPLLLAGYEGMKQREVNMPPAGKVRLIETLQRLAQLCDVTQRHEQAVEWRKKLAALGTDEK